MKQPQLQSLLVLAAAGISSAAGAQAIPKEPAYPARPIRMVVPFTPASATDIIARIIGPRLAEKLGWPNFSDRRRVSTRAVTSLPPSGARPISRRIGLVG